MKNVLIKIYGFLRRKINNRRLKELFNIGNFLECRNEEIYEQNEKGKIKIRFLCSGAWVYNEDLINIFNIDSNYSVKVIIGESNNVQNALKNIRKIKARYCFADEYNVVADKPDIFIIFFPRESTIIKNLKDNCKLVVCVSTELIQDNNSSVDFWNWAIHYTAHDPDYYLFDKLMYDTLNNGVVAKDKIILAGNPIYDNIFNKNMKKNEVYQKFEKLKNKRILLWATDHGVYDGKVSNDITFDLYAKHIFDFFNKHKDFGLIFRPHPTFIKEMFKYGFWSQDKFERMKEYFDKTDNIIFDDSESMNDALVCSDAIIVDAYCSVASAAYPLHKPIGMLYRNENAIPVHKVLGDSLISIKSIGDLLKFMNNFTDDYENLCKLNFVDKSILCYFDGNNSVRAKRIIEEKFRLLNIK